MKTMKTHVRPRKKQKTKWGKPGFGNALHTNHPTAQHTPPHNTKQHHQTTKDTTRPSLEPPSSPDSERSGLFESPSELGLPVHSREASCKQGAKESEQLGGVEGEYLCLCLCLFGCGCVGLWCGCSSDQYNLRLCTIITFLFLTCGDIETFWQVT